MIRVSVMYPGGEGKKFDHDYYVKKHMTLVGERQFQEAAAAHDKELFADVPNVTNITPQMQIAEVIHSS